MKNREQISLYVAIACSNVSWKTKASSHYQQKCISNNKNGLTNTCYCKA